MKIVLPNKEELVATRAFKSYNFENGITQLSITFNDVSMDSVVERFTMVPVTSLTIVRNGFNNVTYDNIKVVNISETLDETASGVVVTCVINN